MGELDSAHGARYNQTVHRRWLLPVLLVAITGAGFWVYQAWWPHRFDQCIVSAAQRYAVEPALVKAVVWRESRFHPRARGRAGELGLMQIRELAAREWAASEGLPSFALSGLLDPRTNTLAGSWYLSKLTRRYAGTDDPIPYALADYNAGRRNVLRWTADAAATNSAEFIRRIGFPATREYVESVMARWRRYQREWPGGEDGVRRLGSVVSQMATGSPAPPPPASR